MFEAIKGILESFVDHPVEQAIIAAVGTFILEDPTVVTCGLLVADERMSFWAAITGLSIGITIGDMWLFFVGRFFGGWVERKQWISPEKFERARKLLTGNLFVAVVSSRFLPGTRIPVFVGAGLFGAHPINFLLVACVASFIWTMFLLNVSMYLGEAILPLLGGAKWYVLGALIIALVVIPTVRKRMAKKTG